MNINDSVTKYLPWFETTKKITLKDLMLHRSGLYKFEASLKLKVLMVQYMQYKQGELMKNFIINIYIMMLIT